MQDAKDRLKKAWDENPLAVIAVGTGVIYAAAKLIDSLSNANNSRAWSKEVDRRRRKTR